MRQTEVRWPAGEGEMAGRVRAHDWGATALGPIARWPPSLRTALDIVLASGHAMQLAWGPERVLLYNDAYAPMLGERHPAALGLPFHEAWPDVWADIEPLVARVFAGETVRHETLPLVMTRHGYPEETWWNFSYSPVRDEAGAVAGLLNVTVDATERVRAERAERERDEANASLREGERRQAFLLALSDALRPLTDPAEIRLAASQVIGEALGADRAYFGDMRAAEGRGFVYPEYIRYGGPSISGWYDYADFRETVDRLRGGAPFVVADVQRSDQLSQRTKRAYAAIRLAAFACLPLIKAGEIVLALTVTSETPRAWSAREVALLREAGERTWDAAERGKAEAALRASAERLRTALSIGTVGVMFWGPDDTLTDMNDAFLAMTGLTRPEALGRSWRALTPPEFREASEAFVARVQATGEGAPYEKQYFRADGTRWWGLFAARKLGDGFVEFVLDVSARREAEGALRASEERFRQFAASSSDALWIRDGASLAMEYASPAIRTVYGIDPEAILGGIDRWLALVAPEDRDTARAHIERARRGESVAHEFRIVRAADGATRWIRNTDFPLRDQHGRVQRIGGIAEDVTEAKAMLARQEVLVNELQHRARNLLGVVRALADRTVRRGGTVEAFEERLQALSRAQGLLSQAGSDTVEVGALVRAELAAHANEASDRVGLAGPAVRLTARQVQNFALALHELTTNALKYGALAGATGRLAVTWEVVPDRRGRRRLALTWIESGVAVVPDSVTRRGYGTELIQEALAYALQAEVAYVLGEDGVRCRIELPLS